MIFETKRTSLTLFSAALALTALVLFTGCPNAANSKNNGTPTYTEPLTEKPAEYNIAATLENMKGTWVTYFEGDVKIDSQQTLKMKQKITIIAESGELTTIFEQDIKPILESMLNQPGSEGQTIDTLWEAFTQEMTAENLDMSFPRKYIMEEKISTTDPADIQLQLLNMSMLISSSNSKKAIVQIGEDGTGQSLWTVFTKQ